MINEANASATLVEVKNVRRSLVTVCDAYSGVMALCDLVRPGLKELFTQSAEENASSVELRRLLDQRNDAVYNMFEMLQEFSRDMMAIDESAANIGGCMDSIVGNLTKKSNEEANHD